ncbi:MAG: FAD-dependent oxidoreductase [Variovorax sp.]|nr:MAG: FAD-dependent oxidoreductase [Variovorax sp.]
MRVIVLGAGLLGVTTAYYLQHLGHEVTVIDRHATPAARLLGLASHRGRDDFPPFVAGSPPLSSPRTTPVGRLLRATHRRLRHAGHAFGGVLASRHPETPVEHMVRLDRYSHETLRALREDAGLSAGPNTLHGDGLMDFYTSARAFQRAVQRAPHLQRLGSTRLLMSADEAVRLEPALAHIRPALVGATYAARTEPSDPSPFVTELVSLCRSAGVRFVMRHTVVALHAADGRVRNVEATDAGGRTRLFDADAYVLALGTQTMAHAATLGLDLPDTVAREDVVTIPIAAPQKAFRIALRDHEARLRFSRVTDADGRDCMRITRTRLAGPGMREAAPSRFGAMLDRAEHLFPDTLDAQQASFQTRVRRTTPHDLPLIGRTPLRNLFLHSSRGPMQWVHACGTGKSLAWIVSGMRPQVNFAFTGR